MQCSTNGVCFVDLDESFPMRLQLQKKASIQPAARIAVRAFETLLCENIETTKADCGPRRAAERPAAPGPGAPARAARFRAAARAAQAAVAFAGVAAPGVAARGSIAAADLEDLPVTVL